MNEKNILLVLAHLFRSCGPVVSIETAVECLSFRWRYGSPSNIRRMLTLALNNELISREGERIKSEFLFDQQEISPNLVHYLAGKVQVGNEIEPIH
ncbi:MAG: hypothetical protein ACTSPR_02950 [Candidatus Thorarchaeota archaeon]